MLILGLFLGLLSHQSVNVYDLQGADRQQVQQVAIYHVAEPQAATNVIQGFVLDTSTLQLAVSPQ